MYLWHGQESPMLSPVGRADIKTRTMEKAAEEFECARHRAMTRRQSVICEFDGANGKVCPYLDPIDSTKCSGGKRRAA